MKVSRPSSSRYTESLFSQHVKNNLLFFQFFFFYLAFFHEYPRFTGQQVKGETISLYPFYHFHPLFRHLDISCIAAESSPVRIAGRRNRTWNLWYTPFRIHCFYTCTGNCCCQENAQNSGNTGKYFSCFIKSN